MIKRACLVAAMIALASCVARPPADGDMSAVPAPSAFLAAIRPSDLGRSAQAVQLITVRRDDKVITAELRLSVEPDHLILVVQDMLGQRLLTVRWSDAGMTEKRSPNLPEVVSPTGILAELVAISWPAPPVQRALEKVGAQLIGGETERSIVQGRQTTLRATIGWPSTRWTGAMSYRNLRSGYTVDVQSVEAP